MFLFNYFKSNENEKSETGIQDVNLGQDNEPMINYREILLYSPIQELETLHKDKKMENWAKKPEVLSILEDLLLERKDLDRVKFFVNVLDVKINFNYALDFAIEEGNMEFTRFLISKGACCSKYAKQMAVINKNFNTFLFADSFCKERSDTNVFTIHRKFDKKNKCFDWGCIPEEYRFD